MVELEMFRDRERRWERRRRGRKTDSPKCAGVFPRARELGYTCAPSFGGKSVFSL